VARVSWSLGLYSGDGSTFLGPLHFLMERKMLLGIKRRAEALDARLGQAAESPGERLKRWPSSHGSIAPDPVAER
jgi:hypothetical protein